MDINEYIYIDQWTNNEFDFIDIFPTLVKYWLIFTCSIPFSNGRI